ncbi:hypothetical protein [Spongiimicrobium sp. 2-473A-2-J]|uniref:hypothetical protein n=1 Tax=Eudoraea algarum TaxID=3417568 RepID=UPI003D366503
MKAEEAERLYDNHDKDTENLNFVINEYGVVFRGKLIKNIGNVDDAVFQTKDLPKNLYIKIGLNMDAPVEYLTKLLCEIGEIKGTFQHEAKSVVCYFYKNN